MIGRKESKQAQQCRPVARREREIHDTEAGCERAAVQRKINTLKHESIIHVYTKI